MKIHDLSFAEIERINFKTVDDIQSLMSTARRPMIFEGLANQLSFLEKWDLSFFEQMESSVPVQQPETDGVNYFFKYFAIPMKEFISRIKSGDNLYIGAREILGEGGKPSGKDGLASLADSLEVPNWFKREKIRSANLWIGAGNNKTLLHYDPWNSIQLLRQGQKEFFVFRNTDTRNLHPFSVFNFKALYQGKVLHSKIRPMTVQKRYQKRFKELKGFRGTVNAGDVVFIPAGYWHYVESEGQNIGVNFFVHSDDQTLHRIEPLRSYWIKDRIMLHPVRWLYRLKYNFFQVLRKVFPKRVGS
ncbi:MULTISPECIES: cupin-like domain-containing protein [Marinobacter]|jgi:hypothetical protein|uniref:Cupin-like domain-containing protein n=1 Tax=Marinobacter salarius TaxID=1420917 RepID=A0ABY1FJC2_9GAMM|nr:MULTISPECIES: cupin-like domain-containing protein [Marinobacter]KXJ45181.1 MAG: hypothetical protein AXW11_13850 [Marinobacter sp. Hex_13]SFL45428.1 Cupin-like domain-containing protein [Marinobacter salarius]|tara:strand:+ start:410 stop:1315 length:906 start_codon:yes stop_codon:yes gene_type:complete